MIIKRLLGYFITGLAILLPIGLTAYFVYRVVVAVDSLCDFDFPGAGLLIVITGVSFLGMLASLFVGRPIFERLERIFVKTPIFGYIYKAFKDLTLAFVGKENKFSKPVMVRLSQAEVYKIGFVTSQEAELLLAGETNNQHLFAVYLPISYSVAGDLYFVPADQVIPLSISSKDAMQYAVSGGIIQHNVMLQQAKDEAV